MDEKYSWKRTEDMEIDLADLLRRLLGQWKQIMLCALAFAVLGAGFGYVRNRRSMGIEQEGLAQQDTLTEKELQDAASAAALADETAGLEEYLEHSVLMQADPYHKQKVTLLYSISQAKRNTVQTITEAYLSFLVHGGMAESLQKSGDREWNMDKSYLAELVTAYQKTYGLPYQIAADSTEADSLQAEALFYVEITGRDAGMARKLAQAVQSVLKQHQDIVTDTAGSHRLELVSSQESVQADTGLQAQQHDKRAQLVSAKDSLRASVGTFRKEQLAVFQEMTGSSVMLENMLEDIQEGLEEDSIGSLSGISLKYVLAGLFAGIFVFCGISACAYLLSDTVKSTGEIKEIYTFPFYGKISLKASEKKRVRNPKMRGQDAAGAGKEQDVLEQEKAQVLNRLRLACTKQGITKLYAASDFTLDSRERECLEKMAAQLKNWGIELHPAEHASQDAAVWDALASAGNVLLVCRIGTTTHQAVDEAMEFYLENGISVAGAMAF